MNGLPLIDVDVFFTPFSNLWPCIFILVADDGKDEDENESTNIQDENESQENGEEKENNLNNSIKSEYSFMLCHFSVF
jgi:hypothetical protein